MLTWILWGVIGCLLWPIVVYFALWFLVGRQVLNIKSRDDFVEGWRYCSIPLLGQGLLVMGLLIWLGRICKAERVVDWYKAFRKTNFIRSIINTMVAWAMPLNAGTV